MSNVDRNFIERLGLPTAFPASFFPGTIEAYRQNLVANTVIPGEFAAAGMLAAFSGATGNSVVGRHGPKRFVPVSLFLVMIGQPGSAKSPALQNTLEAIRREQQSRVRAGMGMPQDVLDVAPVGAASTFEGEGDFGEEEDLDVVAESRLVGEPKKVRHLLLSDTTVAGVREALLQNPRGVLTAVDEAVNLFHGPGKGSDRAAWLEIWNCQHMTVSRRSGKPPIVSIPRSFVTVVGGTQPDIFPKLKNQAGDDGLLDRTLLFGEPSDGWPQYGRCNIDVELAANYNGAVDRLIQHRDTECDDTLGSSVVLDIPEACSDLFEACHQRLVGMLESCRANPKFGGVVTKAIANAERLAVLRSCIRWASGDEGSAASPVAVTAEDAAEACRVAEFCFGRALLWRPEIVGSAARPLTSLPAIGPAAAQPTGEAAAGLARKIVAYMERKGIGEVEIRKLQSSGGFGGAKSPELRAACQMLVDGGQGSWLDLKRNQFGLLAASDAEASVSSNRSSAEGGAQ